MQGNRLAELSHGMHTEPLSEECRRIWQRGDHALIGISAGNSYFNQERLTALLTWAGRGFRAVDVVYVDTHIDTMLIAEGRAPAAAAKSARATLKDLRRRIRRAVEGADADHRKLRIRPLSELVPSAPYQAVRRRTDRTMSENPEFAAACEEMVRQVVKHRSGIDADHALEARLVAGLSYVRAEAPLFVDAPSVFGVPSSVVCYHTITPISDQLTREDSTVRAAPGNGYVIVRPPGPDGDADSAPRTDIDAGAHTGIGIGIG